MTLEIEGGRSSNDPFFTKGNREPDPLDVRKSALANWEARAVTALLGLGNLSAEDLLKNGVDVTKITGVDFQKGAEGGGQTTLISDPQRKRLFAIQRASGVSNDAAKSLLAAYGWDSSTKVTREKYDEVVTVLQGGPAAVVKRVVELAKPAVTP